jgi:ATP-dependent RNA helicase DHX8/PRP22
MGPSGSQNTGQVAKKLKSTVNNIDHDARKRLPVWQHRKNILSAVAEKQVTVLIGETGSGKTTQTPQFLAEAGYIKRGVIGVTQPRRVAAVSVCKRVADECSVPVGDKVGYQVRFQEASGPNTKIRFMTDGILVREAVLTPDFSRYSVIVLDEAHERSIHTDILLGLCKQVEEKFTKFSGKPRDARKNHGIQPIFGQISGKIVFKIQNKTLAKFQILASDSEIDLHSEIQN